MNSVVVLIGVCSVILASLQIQDVVSQPGGGGRGGPFGSGPSSGRPGGPRGPGGNGGGPGGRPGNGGSGPFGDNFPDFDDDNDNNGPFGGSFPFNFGPFRPPVRPPARPLSGVFESDPKNSMQMNMYAIYNDVYANSALVGDIISLNISRNGSTYNLLEQVVGGAAQVLQSFTYQIGVPTDVQVGGASESVIVQAVGRDQLLFSYNTTSATGLKRMLLSVGGPSNGLRAEYRTANNDTGRRSFRRDH